MTRWEGVEKIQSMCYGNFNGYGTTNHGWRVKKEKKARSYVHGEANRGNRDEAAGMHTRHPRYRFPESQ